MDNGSEATAGPSHKRPLEETTGSGSGRKGSSLAHLSPLSLVADRVDNSNGNGLVAEASDSDDEGPMPLPAGADREGAKARKKRKGAQTGLLFERITPSDS